MKKIIVILLSIFCFYACKSVNSSSDAYMFMNEDTTADVYKQVYKGQTALLAFFYENVCDNFNTDILKIYGQKYAKIEAVLTSVTREDTTYYAKKDFFGKYCNIIDDDFTVLDKSITYQVLSDEGDHVKLEIKYLSIVNDNQIPVATVSNIKQQLENGEISPTRVQVITSNDKSIKNLCRDYRSSLERNSGNYITKELTEEENGYNKVRLYDGTNEVGITSTSPSDELIETNHGGYDCSWTYNMTTPCKKDYMEYHTDSRTQKDYRCKVKTNLVTYKAVRDLVLTPKE